MKLITPKEELYKLKCRGLVELECEYCSSHFFRTKNEVLKVFGGHKAIALKYCSRTCSFSSRKTQILCKCKSCGKGVLRNPSDLNIHKPDNVFCSRSCSAKYSNANKSSGSTVSKLEIWLQHKLIQSFPNLSFDFNSTKEINAELDIFIPSLKLAFEINGIFHYEPIFGEDKLLKTKNNDNRKFQACAENGISLCVLNTSSQKIFKEKTSLLYWDIIKKIIINKINGQEPEN